MLDLPLRPLPSSQLAAVRHPTHTSVPGISALGAPSSSPHRPAVVPAVSLNILPSFLYFAASFLSFRNNPFIILARRPSLNPSSCKRLPGLTFLHLLPFQVSSDLTICLQETEFPKSSIMSHSSVPSIKSATLQRLNEHPSGSSCAAGTVGKAGRGRPFAILSQVDRTFRTVHML